MAQLPEGTFLEAPTAVMFLEGEQQLAVNLAKQFVGLPMRFAGHANTALNLQKNVSELGRSLGDSFGR